MKEVLERIKKESKEIFDKSVKDCGGKDYVNLEDIINDVARRNNMFLDDEAVMDIFWEIIGLDD
jgi:hypothetical protein